MDILAGTLCDKIKAHSVTFILHTLVWSLLVNTPICLNFKGCQSFDLVFLTCCILCVIHRFYAKCVNMHHIE